MIQTNMIVKFITPLPNDQEGQVYFITEIIGTAANLLPVGTGLLNPPIITATLDLLTDDIEYVMGEFDENGDQTGTPHVPSEPARTMILLSEKSMKQLIVLLDEMGNKTDIYDWVRWLNLPKCDYSVRIAHRVRGKIMNIKRFADKYKGLAIQEYQGLRDNLQVLESLNNEVIAAHLTLNKLDKIFDNTH